MNVTTAAAPSSASLQGQRLWPNALGSLAVGLCILAFWILQHPYEGVVHDAVTYAVSAAAQLHPRSLGTDVMLTLGTQDHYTIFGSIASFAIARVGLEHAAALITLIGHAALFTCAWLLARRLVGPVAAALSAGLLVVLPSIYGAGYVFSYTEPFMTPRVPAEALVLAGLAAAYGRRYWLCGICLIAALALHPLMAAAGLAMLFMTFVAMNRPRLILIAGVAGLALMALVSSVVSSGPLRRFDPEWFGILQSRLTYLFPTLWSWKDWAHGLVPIATLIAGAIGAAKGSVTRSTACAALATGLSGLALSILGGDLLHVVGIAQIQPWRWLWLTNVFAVLLIPAIATDCWRKGDAARAAGVLLVGAWIGIDESFGPVLGAFAVLIAAVSRQLDEAGRGRILLLGSYLAAAISLLVLIASILAVLAKLPSIAPDKTLYDTPFLLLVRRIRPWASGGVLTAAVLLLIWWCGVRQSSRTAAALALTVAAILCLMLSPLAYNAWTRVEFNERVRAQFAQWRQIIPQNAQVLWGESPVGPWFLLDRPSYWSTRQMAGLVFSRAMTMELTRREWVLTHQTPRASPSEDLTETCVKNPELSFIVTPRDLGTTPFPIVEEGEQASMPQLRLYSCAGHRG